MTSLFETEQALTLGNILEALIADKLLDREAANNLLSTKRGSEQSRLHPLATIVLNQPENLSKPGKPLTMPDLLQWMKEKTGLEVAHIDPLKINVAAITQVMSFKFAQRHQILCIENRPQELVIATAQPMLTSWVTDIEQTTRKTVKRVLANPADIGKYTVEFYSLSRSVSGAKNKPGSHSPLSQNFEQLLQLGNLKDPDAQDQHIINIVDWLLQYAFDQRASDIHIEPRREQGKVRFRIDGVLHQIYELPADVTAAVTSRIKILGRMNVAEKRRPQDGRIKTRTPDGSEVELRLSTLPTAFGEKLVMRIFDPDVLLRSFSDLGLAGNDLARWQEMTEQAHGIVLVTGPTGSGKTTTLYSTLKQLATEEVNVSTIEDPIEMVEDSFNQTQLQPGINLDFAAGIRTLMRQDPDIIMVGEIRDLETAEMAAQAALTGHLVLSTLHTNDAPSAISRLQDLGVVPHLIKATVNGIMAQRLVRTLCPHCKVEQPTDPDLWQALIEPLDIRPPEKSFRAESCLECRSTGYRGRQGIYEIVQLSEAIRALINDNTDTDAIRKQAIKEGMRSLRLSGAQKVMTGVTSIEEVMRVAPTAER